VTGARLQAQQSTRESLSTWRNIKLKH
jgi:hypothetical protein